MENHPYYLTVPKMNRQNIFLTSTSSENLTTKLNVASSSNQPNFMTKENDKKVNDLKRTIFGMIVQFKSIQNCTQINHLFNQILYSLDTSYSDKKGIDRIEESLKEQTNIIKLTRLQIKLRNLKKDLLKIRPSQHASPKNIKSSQCFRKANPSRLNNSQKITLRSKSNQIKEKQQLKESLKEQILYRQHLNKIQNQGQKHFNNKQQFIIKQVSKAKELNKRVNDVYEKNKRLHKQKMSQYKYQQLFYPEKKREDIKKRGQLMNSHLKSQSQETSEIDLVSSEFIKQSYSNSPKSGVLKDCLTVPSCNKDFTRKNLNVNFQDPQNKKKSDINTFKTLNDLMNNSMKMNNSINTKNSIKVSWDLKNQQRNNNQLFKQKIQLNTKSYNCSPFGKSEPLYNNLDQSLKKDTKFNSKWNEKLQLVKEKKEKLQEERLNKNIAEAVEKEQRILKIYHKRLELKTKKCSPDSSEQKENKVQSTNISPSRSIVRKAFRSRKQLNNKQRNILTKIQNKLTNKETFLQQRVNKIRQRLQKENQTRERKKQLWDQYISFTQSASAFQSKQDSPRKTFNRTHHVQSSNSQQKIIRNFHLSRQKQTKKNQMQQKLSTLPLQELKKQLAIIEIEQNKSSKQNLFF